MDFSVACDVESWHHSIHLASWERKSERYGNLGALIPALQSKQESVVFGNDLLASLLVVWFANEPVGSQNKDNVNYK